MLLRTAVLSLAALLLAACSLPGETLRIIAYSEIARDQMAAGDPGGALETSRRAWALTPHLKSKNEQLFGIPAAAVAHLRAGDMAGADRTIAIAKTGPGTVIAHTTMALALMDSGFPVEAKRAAGEALKIARSLNDDDASDQLEIYAVWAQAMTGDIAGALRNAGGIHRRENRDSLLALIAAVQVDAGDIAGALATVGPVAENGVPSDSDAWLSSQFFRGIAIDSLIAFDSLLFESRMPLKAILMNRIAVAQARTGNDAGARQSFLAAIQFAERAPAAEDRVRSVSNIALAKARAGDIAGAMESLGYADKLAARSSGENPADTGGTRTYAKAIRAAIAGGDAPGKLIQDVESPISQRELLVTAAMANVQLGKTRQAVAYLEAASNDIAQDDDLSMAGAGFANLAAKLMAQGDRAGAMAAAQRSLSIAERTPEFSEDRVIGMFFAAVALGHVGEFDLALEIVARIKVPSPG